MNNLWQFRRGLMMAQGGGKVGPGYYYAATSNGLYRSKTPTSPSSWINVLSANLNGVKFAANGTGICIKLHAGIYRSVDGETWSQVLSSSTYYLCGIASDGHGNWLVSGYNGWNPLLLKSIDDGVSWTNITSALGSYYSLSNVGYHDGLWIVTERYYEGIYRSSDISTWVKSTRSVASVNDDRNLLSYVNDRWLVWGDSATPVTSPDGITWTAHSVVPSNTFSRAIYRDGLYWIAGKDTAGGQSAVLTSPDLSTWTVATAGISAKANAELCILGTKDGVISGGTYGYLIWWDGSSWAVVTTQYDSASIWGFSNINDLEYW